MLNSGGVQGKALWNEILESSLSPSPMRLAPSLFSLCLGALCGESFFQMRCSPSSFRNRRVFVSP